MSETRKKLSHWQCNVDMGRWTHVLNLAPDTGTTLDLLLNRPEDKPEYVKVVEEDGGYTTIRLDRVITLRQVMVDDGQEAQP